MRDFEMRMAEIRRRSDICIQKQKKRKRLLYTCALPVLCICLCCAFIWVADSSQPSASLQDAEVFSPPPHGTLIQEQADASGMGNAIHSVQVSCDNQSVTISASGNLKEIQALLDMTEQPPIYGAVVPEESEGPLADQPILGSDDLSQTPPAVYTLLVTMTDGSVAEYTLSGSSLQNLNTGSTVQLTPQSLAQLKLLLGI